MREWLIEVFEVNPDPKVKAAHVDNVGLPPSSKDAARDAARRKLVELGRDVRSINFATRPHVLVAYVMPKVATKKGKI